MLLHSTAAAEFAARSRRTTLVIGAIARRWHFLSGTTASSSRKVLSRRTCTADDEWPSLDDVYTTVRFIGLRRVGGGGVGKVGPDDGENSGNESGKITKKKLGTLITE